MINEVELLSRDCDVFIDVVEKSVRLEYKKNGEKCYDIDTSEGVRELDKWYERWSSFVKVLIKNNETVWVALSGGMDSRAAFAPFVSDDIDLNRVTIHSIDDTLHTHAEDFKISNKIGKILNFSLNQEHVVSKYITISNALSSAIENYVRLGIHSEVGFLRSYRMNRRFFFGGSGGENLRSHWNMSIDDFINQAVKRDNFYSLDAAESIRSELNNSINYIEKNIKSHISDRDVLNALYEYSRLRNHFGSGLVRGVVGNSFELSPLMDPSLKRINQDVRGNSDKNLLFALIYERFIPQIDEVEFDSNRKIEEQTKALAKKINKEFPRQKTKESNGNLRIVDNAVCYIPTESAQTSWPGNDMYSYFYSDSVKNKICKLLGEEVYNRAVNDIDTKKFHPERLCYKLLAVAMVHDVISLKRNIFSFVKEERNECYYNSGRLVTDFYNFVKKARIDVKNFGKIENDLVIDQEKNDIARASVGSPAWFTNESGKGYVITSHAGNINLHLKCKGDGSVQFYFRGIDYRHAGKRYPVWVDYTSIIINGKRIFDSVQSAWHDKPILYTMKVADGQMIYVQIEWRPHGYDKKEFFKLVETFFENPIR